MSTENSGFSVSCIASLGHDTTSHAIAWTTWCLATNPAVQEKLYEELNAHFGDYDRDITVQDLKELKYLDNCIKESMRVFSPVPVIMRELRNPMVIGGSAVLKIGERERPGGAG